MEGVGLEVGQRVGGGSRDRSKGAPVKPGADPLCKVGGEETLVVRNFLEMLPLAEFPYGVEATLSVELVVEWFILRHADAGGMSASTCGSSLHHPWVPFTRRG